jgi:excisionase family DNA binding protein
MTANDSAFLTVEQFAERLQVSRTTVFAWLKNGDLREGDDYLRLGRILRFRWPTFPAPQPSPKTCADVELQPEPSATLPRREKRVRSQQGTTPAINLDY